MSIYVTIFGNNLITENHQNIFNLFKIIKNPNIRLSREALLSRMKQKDQHIFRMGAWPWQQTHSRHKEREVMKIVKPGSVPAISILSAAAALCCLSSESTVFEWIQT